MHKALRINEVLREIFIHIRDDDDPDDARLTAYHTALACKDFHTHALDALWFSMTSLKPLLKLIPKSIQKRVNGVVYLTTVPCKEDLAIFDLYACRVHELTIPIKHRIKAPVVMNLLDCLGRSSLLPNLRVLKLEKGAQPNLDTSDMFLLCSNLQRLDIHRMLESDLALVLPRAVMISPSIRHLTLSNNAIPTYAIPLLRHLRQLTSLDTRNHFILSPESFSTSFPFSTSLTSWSALSISFPPGDNFTGDIQFSALTTLKLIDAVPAENLLTLFSAPLFPNLENLTLCAPPYGNGSNDAYKESWLKLFPLLLKNQPRLRLLVLRGDSDDEDDDDDDDEREAIEMDIIDFFGDIQSHPLQQLHFQEDKLLKPLTAASISRLCTALPDLESLTLHTFGRHRLTFDQVAAVAAGLPRLRHLEIGIDGIELASPPSVPLLGHKLKVLSIDGSAISDPFLFVRYVDRLFPFAEIDSETPLVPFSLHALKGDKLTVVLSMVTSALKLVRACHYDRVEYLIKQYLSADKKKSDGSDKALSKP